jgi:hypothetical protein
MPAGAGPARRPRLLPPKSERSIGGCRTTGPKELRGPRCLSVLVAEGDLVAQRIHFAGTHTGTFQGLPPTQRKVTFSGLELNRFVDGRVREHWFQLDALGLLQQLGLVVVPGPRLLPRILTHQLKKLRNKG